ncbi:MAG: HWE histidine kinase domain-containing protein [Pseudomonadota bacterium]
MDSVLPEEGQSYDLTNCDREPIHILGRVQSYGALLALTPDWIVAHASENISDFLGKPADDLIGTPVAMFLDEQTIHDLRSCLQLLSTPDSIERLFRQTIGSHATPVDMAVHVSGRMIIVEFEDSDPRGQKDYLGQVRPMIDRVARAGDVERLWHMAARQLRGLVGFDRVMIYRFEPDETGTVVAEALRPGLEPYLGLRYPASDIPKQARELYRRSALRIISDVDDLGHAIVPNVNPEGEPLDLSLSVTRAVSPIHLEYLRNMGVAASMSVSILKRGKLWGLFACHHEMPLKLPNSVRTAAELFAQLFSFLLDQKEGDIERDQRAEAQRVHDRLMAQLAGGAALAESFETIVDAIQEVIPHDGAVAWVDRDFISKGSTPTQEEFAGLVRFLNTTASGSIFTTDDITSLYAAGESFADRASGLLVLPVSRKPRDYIVLFRREIARSVTWAGNPQKPVEMGPNGIRLTPRKSFEAWQQIVRGTSEPWTPLEVSAADALRVTLLEVVLKLTDEALEERTRAQERQELLIAELNHRVRNILNLIRGLINQSKGDAVTALELTEVIGGRIQALARAHDQITAEEWSSAALDQLIETECEAYLAGGARRVEITGDRVSLDPVAYSTMALVIHELVTNAAKYGALSDNTGKVTVRVRTLEDATVEIEWTERGGPPIQSPPTRRGFGSTIIERSVPYDLKGDADVRLDVAGLTATFKIPPQFITDAEAEPTAQVSKPESARSASAGGTALRHVLIVEDNMIIALDTEEVLHELGAQAVSVAPNVREALATIAHGALTYAILDVNLGSETSAPIADRLAAEGIPFAFATGYGETTALSQSHPDAPVLKKPYTKEAVAALFGL